jgi:hypothetical protein
VLLAAALALPQITGKKKLTQYNSDQLLINGHKLTENNSDQMDTIQWTIDTFSSKYSIQYSQTVACIYHFHILQ